MTDETLIINMKNNTIKPSAQDISVFSKLGHEMKVAVHGINGVASYMHNNWDSLDENVKQKNMKVIMDTSNNLRDLLEALLTRDGRTQKLEFNFQNTDIVNVAKLATTYFRDLNSSNEHIKIDFNSELAECVCIADQFWLTQLITNLLSNAVNYSEKGVITVQLRQKSDKCIISVKDEGVGIPENELNSIFKPFQGGSNQSTNEYYSTGLGLAICREIIEAHGGAINASNNETVGSTIEFFIPIKLA